ncbi:MAG: cupin [Rothia sp. (in: high G+C Gram-positive bacteria)]|uniref:cupin n=1 Tax=Rothia sp. (in: high G+C Gram-positive bacteria) TaxID=1885016 RepID=UPI0026DF7F63|nr:cupin [Rothia sp. (in: high G+C Gram-positive bacteria)]MDO5751142.1 cupin [Rothia sp. (in: high G+C Gram-positive bacteria)]
MAGTNEGTVLVFPQLQGYLTPFEDKPQAKKLLDGDGANITIMELAAGQSWHEHYSVHPIIVQALKGAIDFRVKDQDILLVPGKPIHVTAKLLHSLTAREDSTLMVTMLTGESHPQPKISIEEDVTVL